MAILFIILAVLVLMIIISTYRRTRHHSARPNPQSDNSATPIIPYGVDTSGHGKAKGGSSESGSSDHSFGDSGGDGGGGGGD